MLAVLAAPVLAILQAHSGAPPELRVRVERGRAELDGSVLVADGALAGGRVEGGGELRLDARSSAALRWSGRASLELAGPARCVLGAGPAGEPRLEVASLASAHLEVREGAVDVELFGQWTAHASSGVTTLASSGGSGLWIERLAGEPLAVQRVGADPAHARRVTVAAGQRVYLPADPLVEPRGEPRSARAERATPWSSFAWPWRASEPDPSAAPAAGGRWHEVFRRRAEQLFRSLRSPLAAPDR